jgi:GT2 family glycosyltransferase
VNEEYRDIFVGIPTLNGPHRLLRCLKSIFDPTCTDPRDLRRMRVLVADDGSTDENLKVNKDVVTQFSHLGVELLFGHGRTGIAKTWNRLVRHGQSNVVILINDDIEVVPYWLDVLDFSVRSNLHVGMVGLNSYVGVTKDQVRLEGRLPLTIDYHEAKLHLDGRVVCSRCELRPVEHREAQLWNGGGNLLASTGSIFAFRRECFDRVGGFDERYFRFFEEVDFGVALQRRGLWNYMASYPICYHTGGETNSDPQNGDSKVMLDESRVRFIEKWGKGPESLREEFRARGAGPSCREWNTMLRNLR